MKQSVPSLFLFLGVSHLANAGHLTSGDIDAGTPPPERPNIIVVLTDDQGYGDFSCHGNPVLKTPALDKLYAEGIRFSDFHVSPLSTPTRGQLLTGLDAMRNKAATVLTGRNLLRRDLVTMPEVFRENGYATGIFGKWHLGDSYPDRPMDRGFQRCVWLRGWGLLSETEYDNDYYETRYLDGLEVKQSGEYCTNLWFNRAMEWMDEMAARKTPFFTYLALNAPHGPFESPAQDFSYYRPKVQDDATANFLGMIRNIDRNMARLDNWLEESGLKENTLVVFMNDNGGTGGVKLYNAGMRGEKGGNYEGGHRAACLIRWPDGGISGGRTVPDAAQIQDLLPTFIALCGLDAGMIGYPLDGKSLVPVLRGNGTFGDRMFVVQYGGHVRPEKYFGCVVWNSWRLVGENELYDISADPGQKNDLAENHPEIVTKMKAFYENWWSEVGPGIDEIIPVIIDPERENPVIFNANNWIDGAVNTQWKVAQAAGASRGGTSHIRIAESGRYTIELSRWPFHLGRKLTVAGPDTSVGGTQIRTGKALPVHSGCISLNKGEILARESLSGASSIAFEVELQAGTATFEGWFRDKNGHDLCGAYYVKFEKIHTKKPTE